MPDKINWEDRFDVLMGGGVQVETALPLVSPPKEDDWESKFDTLMGEPIEPERPEPEPEIGRGMTERAVDLEPVQEAFEGFAEGYAGEVKPISPYTKEVIKGFPKAAFHEIKETLSKISPSIEPEDYDIPAREKTYWKILKEPVMDIGGAAVVPRGTNLIQKAVSLYLLGYAANSIAQGLSMTYQIKKPELSSIMQATKFRILSMFGKRPVTSIVPYDAVAAYKKGAISLVQMAKSSPQGYSQAMKEVRNIDKVVDGKVIKTSVSTKIFKPVVVKPTPPVKPTVKPVTPKVAVKPVSLEAEAKKYKTVDDWIKSLTRKKAEEIKIAFDKKHPELADAFGAKQAFYDIWQQAHKPEVKEIKVRKKPVYNIEKAVDKHDFRTLIKAGNVKFPAELAKNFAPEEVKKTQLLFSKEGTSLDKYAQELATTHPELGIKTGDDLWRKAIQQTGQITKTSKELAIEAEIEYNKLIQEEAEYAETEKIKATEIKSLERDAKKEVQGEVALQYGEDITEEAMKFDPAEFEKATIIEKTKAGEQILMPGAPERVVPTEKIKPKPGVKIKEEPLLELKKAKIGKEQEELFKPKLPIAEKPKMPPKALGKPEYLTAPGKLKGIDTFEKVPADSPDVKVKLFEETKKIAKKYAHIIGEKYVPKKFLGIQWGDTKNIFVKALNDIGTTTHEVVHYIDGKKGIFKKVMEVTGYSKAGNPIYSPATRQLRKELTEAYLEFYPNAKKTHKLVIRVKEGLATFIENYIAQPTATRKKYPLLYKEFLQGGKYFDPLLPAMVKDAQALVGAYQKLDPLKKVGSKVLSDDQPIIRDSFLTFPEKVITEIADIVYPIEKLGKMAGLQWTARDPSLWTRVYNNVSGIVNRNINTNKGFTHFKNEELVKLYDYNWQTLVENLKKDKLIDDFSYWLVARREHFAYKQLDELRVEARKASERISELGDLIKRSPAAMKEYKEQLKPKIDDLRRLSSILAKDGFSRPVIDEAYNKYKDQFIEQAKKFDNLVRADLDFVKDSGMVSQNTYDEFIKNEGYATFKRDVYNEVIGEAGEISSISRVSKKVSSLKGRTGSQLTIINPIYSSIKNHSEIMRKGLKQIVLNKVYNLRKTFPEIMQKIPLVKVPRPEGGFDYPQDRDPNILMAMENGQRKPLLASKEIMTVINELLTFKNVHIFERLVVKAARMFTKGTTGLYPPFAIQNFFVDQVTASAQTMTKYKPVISQLNILYKQLRGHSKNAEYLQEYLMLGGQRHTFVGWLDMTPNEFFTAITKEKTALKKAGDLLERGTEILAIPAQYSEILTRAVEYINSRNAGEHQIVALEKAGRVSAPFHHIGRWGGGSIGKTTIKSIPYFNASLEVLAQFSRTMNNPKTRRRATFVIFALTAAMAGGFASLLLMGTKRQRELYKDIHPRELSHYIFFPSPDGKTLLRFRIPEQMGAFGTLINMALSDVFLGAQYKKKEYLDAATAWVPDQFNITDPVRVFFSWMPHLIGVTTEVLMNKRTYPKVMPIEGMSMERHEKQFRIHRNTGWLAKYIGKHLELSPIKIDYLIEGYLGRTSKFIKGGKITNPVVKEAYFRSGRRLIEFYELKKANREAYDSLKTGKRKFTIKEAHKIVKTKEAIKEISVLLGLYKKVEDVDDNKKIQRLRELILNKIDSLQYIKD